jgi:hypothetical protein
LFRDQDWYETENFAKHTDQPSWCLIRKTPVKNSLDKTWSEQQLLLDHQTDEIPLSRQIIYTTVLHFLDTGERLFRNSYVRTSDVDSDGDHVNVGFFGEGGFYINGWSDIDQFSSLGVASARNVVNLET